MMELTLNGCKIVENVRMIEFEVVQYCSAATVMNELRSLVEEGGVVFVRLDNEERRLPEPRGDGKVFGHSADQEARRAARALQDPGEHGRYGGLAVGSCDAQNVPTGEHIVGKPLR